MSFGNELFDKIYNLSYKDKGMNDEQFNEYLKLLIKLCDKAENNEIEKKSDGNEIRFLFEFESEFGSLKSNIWDIRYYQEEIEKTKKHIEELNPKDFRSKEDFEDTKKFLIEDQIGYHKEHLDHALKKMSLKQYETAYQLLLKYMLENKKSNVLLNCFRSFKHEDQIEVAKYFVEQKDTNSLLFLAQQNTIGYSYISEHKDIIKSLQNLICEKKDKMEYYRFLTYYADHYYNSKNKTDEFKPVLKEMANQLFEMIKKDKDLALCEDIILGRIDKDYKKENNNNVGKLLNRRELLKFYCQNATEKQINHLFDEIDNYRKESEKEPVVYLNTDYEYLC